MITKKITFTLFAAAIISLSSFFALYSKGKQASDSLIAGTNPTYFPYEIIDEKGKIIGFDIDLAQAIADQLGKKLIIKEISFDALILSLKQERIDMIASGMSITPSREAEITMIPYQGKPLKSLTLVFWDQSPEGIASLEEYATLHPTIAVQVATFQHHVLEKYKEVCVKPLDGNSELILDLKYGKSDAALLEPHIAKALQLKMPSLSLIEIPLNQKEPVFGNGIGIKKERSLLAQQINYALEELRAKGSIENLEIKWFGGAE